MTSVPPSSGARPTKLARGRSHDAGRTATIREPGAFRQEHQTILLTTAPAIPSQHQQLPWTHRTLPLVACDESLRSTLVVDGYRGVNGISSIRTSAVTVIPSRPT
jgi:hypothetical protein